MPKDRYKIKVTQNRSITPNLPHQKYQANLTKPTLQNQDYQTDKQTKHTKPVITKPRNVKQHNYEAAIQKHTYQNENKPTYTHNIAKPRLQHKRNCITKKTIRPTNTKPIYETTNATP